MDESRGLQRVARALATQVVSGAPAQLAVDEGDKAIARGEIATSPGLEQGRNRVVGWGRRQGFLVASVGAAAPPVKESPAR